MVAFSLIMFTVLVWLSWTWNGGNTSRINGWKLTGHRQTLNLLSEFDGFMTKLIVM